MGFDAGVGRCALARTRHLGDVPLRASWPALARAGSNYLAVVTALDGAGQLYGVPFTETGTSAVRRLGPGQGGSIVALPGVGFRLLFNRGGELWEQRMGLGGRLPGPPEPMTIVTDTVRPAAVADGDFAVAAWTSGSLTAGLVSSTLSPVPERISLHGHTPRVVLQGPVLARFISVTPDSILRHTVFAIAAPLRVSSTTQYSRGTFVAGQPIATPSGRGEVLVERFAIMGPRDIVSLTDDSRTHTERPPGTVVDMASAYSGGWVAAVVSSDAASHLFFYAHAGTCFPAGISIPGGGLHPAMIAGEIPSTFLILTASVTASGGGSIDLHTVACGACP